MAVTMRSTLQHCSVTELLIVCLVLVACAPARGFAPKPRRSSSSPDLGILNSLNRPEVVDDTEETTTLDQKHLDRRALLTSLVLSSVAVSSRRATAYDRVYPGELDSSEAEDDQRQRQVSKILEKKQAQRTSLIPAPLTQPVGAVLWGLALWFLTGSRSNPLVTPLANLLYNEKDEQWLKDRNDGLFANLPLPLFVVLAVTFIAVGFGMDALLTVLSDSNHNTSLQLAGVSLIGGGALELGRIASGEKKQTRDESDRSDQLEQEFEEFAERRLVLGGSSKNCHRNEVVAAFRRYFAKYRQADNPDYPLTDLEIEQLLRSWSRARGVEMSSAGFYSGLQINVDADVFTTR